MCATSLANIWSVHFGSSFAEGIGGGIAVKQMDDGAGDALMFTGLGVIGLKAVKQLMRTAKGISTLRRRRDPTEEA